MRVMMRATIVLSAGIAAAVKLKDAQEAQQSMMSLMMEEEPPSWMAAGERESGYDCGGNRAEGRLGHTHHFTSAMDCFEQLCGEGKKCNYLSFRCRAFDDENQTPVAENKCEEATQPDERLCIAYESCNSASTVKSGVYTTERLMPSPSSLAAGESDTGYTCGGNEVQGRIGHTSNFESAKDCEKKLCKKGKNCNYLSFRCGAFGKETPVADCAGATERLCIAYENCDAPSTAKAGVYTTVRLPLSG